MNTAVVYSKAGCQPCRLTKKACEDAGYEVIELSLDETHPNKSWVCEYETHFPGCRELPGVCIHDEHDHQVAKWTGFRPDLIRQHQG